MKHSLYRLLVAAAVIAVIAFICSGLLRNATGGAGEIAGDIAWFTFLIATLAVLGLAVTAIATTAMSRRQTSTR